MENLKEQIKKWYLENYADDELGEELYEGVTFQDLYDGLLNHKDVYELLGDDVDSIIRERVFGELADRMDVSYDVIYNLWIAY